MAARWLATTTFMFIAAGATSEAYAQSFNVAGQPLIFTGSGTGSGTTVGSTRDYANVITIAGSQIDARVTLTGLTGATLSSFDSTTNPYAETAFFQPNLNISSVGGHATFLVEFFENGQPVTLQNFYINTYDLDGSGASAAGRQYTDFSGFASYTLASPTDVVRQNVGGATRFVTTVGGNLTYTPGANDFNQIRARVFYTSASSVTVSVGDDGATGIAYFGLDFSIGYAFNNVAPDTTAPVVAGSQSLSYTENQAADAVIGTVAATDAIGVVGFRFNATGTQTSADGYYTIDSAGVVRITASGVAAGVANNDFGILPNSFVYGVEASDAAGNWSSTTSITLNVTAAPPTITGPSGAAGAANSAISVNEAQTAVTTMTANRSVTWSITGGADAARFAINPSTGVVTFVAAPDYEAPVDTDTNNTYLLVVTATGVGGSSAQTVTVTVLDVAEGALGFTGANSTSGGSPAYAFNYAENSAAGATLGTVSASGGTGVRTFSIAGGDPSGWYEIDATSGAIRLSAAGAAAAANDFETGPAAHPLTVQVSDTASATATITVTLTETDVDEAPPLITGPSGGAGAAASDITVNEGVTAVTTFTANEAVTWSISGGADAAQFAINPSTGALTFVAAPDYEAPTDVNADNAYGIVVRATDGAGNQSAQTVVIYVADLNENAPVITGPNGGAGAAASTTTVNEGTTAALTLAADKPVTWSITGGPDVARFTVNPTTGAITFVAAPDYEAPVDANADNAYVIVVTATDSLGGVATQTVTINVADLDETAPVITGPSGGAGAASSAVSVNEGVTAAATLTANEVVTWSITGGADAARFAINPTTGAVTFIAPTDFEAPADANGDNVYLITVTATDGAGNQSVQTLTVTVLDIAEIPPVINGPSGGAGAAASATTVNEGGRAALTLTADKPVTWSITGGPDAARLVIDPVTGAIAFIATPDYEAPTDADGDNAYVIVVTATDSFGAMATQTVTIQVANLDEAAPAITGPSGGAGAGASALTLGEGGTAVTTLTADEAVTWSIAGGPDAARFAVDPSTGAVTFVAPPNFEAPTDTGADNVYVVQIRAVDGAGNASVLTLTVTIVNVDEATARVAAIAPELRADLRSHAMSGLGDMLSFNEGLMRAQDTQCDTSGPEERLTRSVNASETQQDAALDWNDADCNSRYRVLWNAGVAVSHNDGDWSSRGLASVRVERDVSENVTVGVGVLGSSGRNELRGFSDSGVSDGALQLHGYVRAALTDTLRAGAFAGIGRAWYDIDLNHNGLAVAGEMSGDRFVFGAMLSGDIEVSGVDLTTDIVISHAVEDIGDAPLFATFGPETAAIDFAVGRVDMTRISVPVTAVLEILDAERHDGRSADLLLSPGLLCEDEAIDSGSLVCGYQVGARLESDHANRGAVYLDYRFESVADIERNMLGLGYADRFGPRDNLMWSFDLDGGATREGVPEGRVMLQFRVADGE